MIKQFAKVFFWSALAVFFCFLISKNYAKAAFSDIQISEIYYYLTFANQPSPPSFKAK